MSNEREQPRTMNKNINPANLKYSNMKENKNDILKPHILMEDVHRKHNERNITSFEIDGPNSSGITEYQSLLSYKSLSKSRSILQLDRESIVLPRRPFQNIDSILSSFYKPVNDIVLTYPMLENVHYSYNLPIFPNFDKSQEQEREIRSLYTFGHPNDSERSSELPFTKNLDYTERIRTYDEWNCSDTQHPEHLSQAGFYYTGEKDKVRCFSCNLGLKDFSAENNPLVEHVRHTSGCTFLSDCLGFEGLKTIEEYLCQCDAEYKRQYQCKGRYKGGVHTQVYENIQRRILSFKRWPLKECERSLAETGLYYSGYEAIVRCFACDGGFRTIKSKDSLWLDHCFYFPYCSYMETKVGRSVINKIKETVFNISNKKRERIEPGGATFREISRQNHRSLQMQCLEMGFKEQDVDKALTKMAIKGHRQNIDALIDLLTTC